MSRETRVMTAMWKTVPIMQVHDTAHNTFTFGWWMDSSWRAWGLAAPHMCILWVNVSQQVELSFISKHHVQDVGDLGNKCLTPLAVSHSFLHIRKPEFLDNSNTQQVNPSLSLLLFVTTNRTYQLPTTANINTFHVKPETSHILHPCYES
jgi:hypothetical protein